VDVVDIVARIIAGDELLLPDEPPPLTLWAHKVTRSLYFVLITATNSTNGPEENIARYVVYFSFAKKRVRVRKLEEFMDGRFVRVSDPDRLAKFLLTQVA